MVRLILILLLAVAGQTALAAPPDPEQGARLAAIRGRLERHDPLRAEFVQTKQMAALKRPLVINGHVLVSRTDGLLWVIDRPYRVTYVVRPQGIVEIGADGRRNVRTARDVPGLAQVGRVFQALLAADAAALGEYFDTSARGESGGHWQLDLTPRQPQVAQFIRALRIEGGDYVDSVRLEEGGGDSTRIEFRNSRSGGALTAEERRLMAVD